MQRKTQTLAYWQKQFSIDNQDTELIYNRILEENRLLSLDEIAVILVKSHCDAEELASRVELKDGKLYQPRETFAVDEKVVFPLLDYSIGTVQYTREANHPDYGKFTVMGVAFENDDAVREFAINFGHQHALNGNESTLSSGEGLVPPEEIYQSFQKTIRPQVKDAFDNNENFVEFHEQYFLRELLSDFHEGLFNIADAAIDINGGPLEIDSLIEQMGLLASGEQITDLLRFSISYRLENDERFEDVGPAGQSLWYLQRLEPPEVRHTPRRLQINGETSYDVGILDDNLYSVLVDIDDDATHEDDVTRVGTEINEITVTLNYPHRRVGTLPLTPKTQSFFPISYYNPVRFEFIDGRTGNSFPGWVVLKGKYVFGLDEWYKKNKLPIGAYVTLKRSKNPMQVIVDYQATRTQRDWIRMAAVTNNKLSFQMNKEAISCKYDDLMLLGEQNPTEIDQLWLNAENKKISTFQLLCDIFPELSKLNPQSTVHAKTLYSAVNIVRRVSPGIVFQELTLRDCFIPMDHGYWTFDPALKDD
ncbi:MAG: hypothetical protein R3264_00575 [Anaerolineae bacterium]|nr:hypothetical protein [Anaerolineae bacterium]